MPQISSVDSHDRNRLRELAKKIHEYAQSDINQNRINAWKKHNSLQNRKPMMLLFPEGGWEEILSPDSYQCEHPLLREYEGHFLRTIYTFENFQSDNVVDTTINVHKVIHHSGWGIDAHWKFSHDRRGARTFDPVIHEPDDLKKIKKPEITVDESASQTNFGILQDTVGDLMPVRLVGITHLSFHMMNLYSSWRGLEEVMMDMRTNPGMLHEAMSRLEEGYQHLIDQYEKHSLLDLNNDNTYHSSGGNGWTDELPQKDHQRGKVRTIDMWSSSESQELALVSPQHHRDFALNYEKKLLQRFGLNGYGCCEDLTAKLPDVLEIPRIRRISIAPTANVEKAARLLGDKAIFSWKPQPSHLIGNFDESFIRKYLHDSIQNILMQGCVLEIILKDTHSCQNEPKRFDRWSQICRQEIEKFDTN